MLRVTSSKLIVAVAIFLMAFGNISFFTNVLAVYPLNLKNSLFLLSLAVVFGCFIVILLSLVCFRYTIKPVLTFVLVVSSLAAYFMDSYNVIIDDVMIDNIVKTDVAESLDLVSLNQLLYFIFLGVIPSAFIYKAEIIYPPLKKSALSRVKLIGLSLIIVIATILILGGFYASFLREHKPLRFYANPSYYIYSVGKYIGGFFESESMLLKRIGLDAAISASDKHRKLIIFVVGETARTDHFSLNGYSRKTNLYLEEEEVINFTNAWACGTSTAVSVPCMFSIYDRSDYSRNRAKKTENVLDVLQRAGVNVLWLDNNSDSKGVATRIPYENYKTADNNPVCDIECRDEGMLKNLSSYIDQHPQADIFIVLHQMGNHGPAYYKRYPAQFEKFTPTCETNQLEQCSREEIENTYDNAILYTDYFLSKTIALLKKHSDQFESTLFYVSDHGESLGENGLYLHGLPYMIAPDTQKRIPMVMWFSDSFDNRQEVGYSALQRQIDTEYSHDNVFHTILGLFKVETTVYDKEMDITNHEQ
ncbi:MAG: phosphoethanolamine--lipid A transferase [Gammaproteobacteria bacterium]|nr:phosphoethanolamine--lipid A transferase [Gammaproteobacteria bacterium]